MTCANLVLQNSLYIYIYIYIPTIWAFSSSVATRILYPGIISLNTSSSDTIASFRVVRNKSGSVSSRNPRSCFSFPIWWKILQSIPSSSSHQQHSLGPHNFLKLFWAKKGTQNTQQCTLAIFTLSNSDLLCRFLISNDFLILMAWGHTDDDDDWCFTATFVHVVC